MSAEREGPKLAMTISKAISLITNKYSCDMVERHVRALNRIASSYKEGIPLKDLPDLCELLLACSKRLPSRSEYKEPLCRIIALCGLPFLKDKVSDENTYAPNVIEILSILGGLLKMKRDPLQLCVTQAVASFCTAQPSQSFTHGLQVTKSTYNCALVERSGVARSIAEALKWTTDEHTKLVVLKTLQLLSETKSNCSHILAAMVCTVICTALSTAGHTDEMMVVCVELLWNLLENGPQIQVAEQLSNIGCISALQGTLRKLQTTSSSLESRQLRNDVATLCLLTVRLYQDAPFMETGFLQDLCTFFEYFEVKASYQHRLSSKEEILSTLDEMGERKREGGGGKWREEGGGRKKGRIEEKERKHGRTDEDFEFLKSLMIILTMFSSNQAAVQVMSQNKVLRSLLSFAVHNDQTNDGWSRGHFEELQLLALSCLCTLGPHCLEDYMVCQGSTRLLLILEWCSRPDAQFKGHGNAFHGTGGYGSRLAQLKFCVRVLLSMCRTREEAVLQDLYDQGAIPLLVDLLKQFQNDQGQNERPNSKEGRGRGGETGKGGWEGGGGGGGGTDPSLLVELQTDILLIISCLCETDIHRKELFGGYDGIKLLLHCLSQDSSLLLSGFGHHRLLLVATDCVWCTVVGSPVVEDIFLEQAGVFTLLNLFKVCPPNNQSLLLGVLVDLCENTKAIPHVVAWRSSDNDQSCWSLLAGLWRQEERDMEVPREELGTLAGTVQPLVGVEQESYGVPPIPSHRPSAAIIDITENMRAKIYILCCKMGFRYMTDDVSEEDKITLCIIRNYLDFKSAEVWYEVAGELAQEGLRPVTPDQEAVQEILHSHEEKAEQTLRLQSELIEEQKKSDREEEMMCYEKIQRLHHTEEKSKEDFLSFLTRTSNHKALQKAKQQQATAVDASRGSNVGIGHRYHTVSQPTLNVTAYCGRHISIATTPMKLLTGEGQ